MVRTSANQVKIDEFAKKFLEEGDYNAKIFNDPHLPFYALGAFVQGKIDTMDMATVLEIFMAKMCHKDCQVHPLLNLDLDWTEKIEQFFLKNDHFGKFTSSESFDTLDKFKESINLHF